MKTTLPDTFPLIIKSGSTSVKIYEGSNRGKPIYTLTFMDGSGRKREFFRDLSEAKREAKSRAEKLSAGDHAALHLTGGDRHLYVAAMEALRPTGVSLDIAARDFAAAWAILGAHSLVDAARHYAKSVLRGLPEMSVTSAVESYTAAKKSEGASDLYLKDLHGLLGRFATAFSCQLRDITADMLRAYLDGLKVGATTRNNHLRLIRGLFTHAKAHGWLSKSESTAADAIGAAKSKVHVPEIYQPDEMESLLRAASSDFLPWLVLIAFCGVRREEVSRLDWSAVDFKEGCVIIPAAVAKTKRRRKIDLQSNVKTWLAPYKDRTGSIFAIDPRKQMARTVVIANATRAKAKAAPVAWKVNALRHSFCSYRLEQTRNAGQVALEAGNSAAIIMRHYHEIVSAKAMKAYWNIQS